MIDVYIIDVVENLGFYGYCKYVPKFTQYFETPKVRKYCFYCQTFKQKPVFLPLFCGKALWSEFPNFVQKLWGLIQVIYDLLHEKKSCFA